MHWTNSRARFRANPVRQRSVKGGKSDSPRLIFSNPSVHHRARPVGIIAACLLFACADYASATLRIDFALTPPMPPEGYSLNALVAVDVFLVDEPGGNPEGNMVVRAAQLDFSNTSNELDYAAGGQGWFDWDYPGNIGLGGEFFDLITERTIWLWPLATPLPGAQMEIPINGQTKIGDFLLDVGAVPGVYSLDVINAGTTDPAGAALVSLWSGPIYRPGAGLSGGITPIIVVPEPATLALLASACLAARHQSRERKAKTRRGGRPVGETSKQEDCRASA